LSQSTNSISQYSGGPTVDALELKLSGGAHLEDDLKRGQEVEIVARGTIVGHTFDDKRDGDGNVILTVKGCKLKVDELLGVTELARRGPQGQTRMTTDGSVVDAATEAFECYDYSRALERAEQFFWFFCDNYVELVKTRAYGEQVGDGDQSQADLDAGVASARAALRLALDTQLRLFAPFLPFVTEEVWSWWQEGSVHRSSWPTAAELGGGAAMGSEPQSGLLGTAAALIGTIRKAKSDAKLSMRTEVAKATIYATADSLPHVQAVLGDVAAAGRLLHTDIVCADGTRDCGQLSVDLSLVTGSPQ